MTTRETVIELIRGMPEGSTFDEIIAALQEERATAEALRRYDERGGVPDDDLTEEEWRLTVARSFAAELADPREDIYTEEHGEPVDGRG